MASGMAKVSNGHREPVVFEHIVFVPEHVVLARGGRPKNTWRMRRETDGSVICVYRLGEEG